MATAGSTIVLRPCTPSDAGAVSAVHYAALAPFHPFYAAFLALHPRELVPLTNGRALRDEKVHFVKAVDVAADAGSTEGWAADGELVGFIRWTVVPGSDDAGKNATAALVVGEEAPKAKTGEHIDGEQKPEEQPISALFAPKPHLADIWADLTSREDEMDMLYEGAAAGKEHIYLKHLMVHPYQQRRGIGARLLSHVTAIADARALPVFLTSSAEAERLYRASGFEVLGQQVAVEGDLSDGASVGEKTFPIENAHWMRKVAERERELGVEGDGEALSERYRDVWEIERCMLRWPRKVA